ncbi:SusC/RagA family TonB-linked outer membrane protein [Marivirga arenosa]|uniref:TonB-dependent receptor n=1 Tax=Marivirga arenosa TaxID=3059076 RepID=A0AA51ZUU6_9BACT|nr:TonB-dependent receptor [Marivirga sp. BKB1-2]WNB17069.1 TonB-dependent receptor [Marivirga sp. BKB1-2]
MKHILTLITILFYSAILSAQDRVISGKVTDENNEPLPGVNIMIVGTSTGTTTDLTGNYKLSVDGEAQLRFSFIGYSPIFEKINNRSVINVKMIPDFEALSEVVVVGYGTSTKKELTGATAQVKAEKITERKVPRLDQALQGAVAGVNISTNSGSPGGSSNIRIRGISTNGDNNPLILVDGVIYDQAGLNALNPNDIKSVNILKDATAGIYGVRAANGVVLIETKQGSKDKKPTLSFDSYYGVQQTAKKLDLLNAREYAVIKNEAFTANGQSLPFANSQLGEGTDWQDAVFGDAPIQNYNLSVSGGNSNSTYNIGASYFGQQGIVGAEKANFERYNARLNFTTDFTEKLKFINVLLFTHEISSGLPENGIGSVLYNTVNAYPTEPLFTDDRYSYLEEVADIINPLAQMENSFNETLVNKITGKQEISYDIDDHFTVNGRLGYNYSIVDFKGFNPLTWYGPGKFANTASNENLDPVIIQVGEVDGGIQLERGASVTEARTTYLDYILEGFVNYERKFNEIHTVKGTLGISYNEESFSALNGTAFNIPNNDIDLADIKTNLAANGYLNNVGSDQGFQRLSSQFLRAEYDYSKRYLISGILRRDGSTRFGPNNRIGYFGSISGAWVISDEEFYNFSAIEFIKLRASFGIVGNDKILPFGYRGLLTGEGVYAFNDVLVNGAAIGRAANPDLKWETTQQTNIGVDMSVFNALEVTANYFIKDTKDLLFQPPAPAILGTYGAGGQSPIINGGDVRNSGVELELDYSKNVSDDFRFGIGFNVTYLKNEVLSVPEGLEFQNGASFGVGGGIATRLEPGFPIGYFIGYETDGIFQNQAEIDAAPEQRNAQPGDLRFVDQDGDGVIDFGGDTDRTQIGSPLPDFTMGLNLSTSFKGFDISANVFAALGQEIIRNYERQQPYANQLDYVLERWTRPGSSNTVPRVTTGLTQNTVFSDFFVEDGSFVRLRNLQLGYTLPQAWTNPAKISNVRLYLSANNLLTITKYMGFDPDVGSPSPFSAGIDNGIYPQARVIMGGVSLNF